MAWDRTTTRPASRAPPRSLPQLLRRRASPCFGTLWARPPLLARTGRQRLRSPATGLTPRPGRLLQRLPSRRRATRTRRDTSGNPASRPDSRHTRLRLASIPRLHTQDSTQPPRTLRRPSMATGRPDTLVSHRRSTATGSHRRPRLLRSQASGRRRQRTQRRRHIRRSRRLTSRILLIQITALRRRSRACRHRG